jgi:hypothetical protein
MTDKRKREGPPSKWSVYDARKRAEDPDYVEKRKQTARVNREANREDRRARSQAWRDVPENREQARIHAAAKRAEDPQKRRDSNAKSRNTPDRRRRACVLSEEWRVENRPRTLLNYARIRARKKDMEFNLELEDIVIPDVCPVLGVKIVVKKGRSPYAPSVDRIDSSKGYVKGNICVMSWRANSLKRDATTDELRRLGAWAESLVREIPV